MWKTCLKVIAFFSFFLLLFAMKTMPKESARNQQQREREKERGRVNTRKQNKNWNFSITRRRWGGAFVLLLLCLVVVYVLPDVVVVVFRTCCWLSSFAAASASAGSAKMKLIEFIIFYAFLHFARRRRRRRRWPQKCKIRSRIFHILLSDEKTLHEIVLLLLLLLFTINLWNAEKLFLWAIFVYVCRERKREKSENRMRCKWGEKWCNKFRSNYDIWTIKIDRW